MLQDQKIMLAVSKILQRSERQVDEQKIIDTFVDIGILSQLENRNNQIIYGRRGTGKTHLLRVLASNLQKRDQSNVVVYIDARTLGSSAQFSDITLGLKRRCLSLFRDLLAPVYNALLEHIIEHPADNATKALEVVDRLLPELTETGKALQEEKFVASSALSKSDSQSASLGVEAPFSNTGCGEDGQSRTEFINELLRLRQGRGQKITQ